MTGGRSDFNGTSGATRDALAQVSTYLTDLASILDALPREPIAEIAEVLLAAAESDRTVYVLGNGGSAATASHLICDLVKTASMTGHARLRAIALTDNVPLLTAASNDLSYEESFAEQVRLLARPGDVLLAISASGNSPNVVKAVMAARVLDMTVISLAGFGGGQLSALSDICLVVPSAEYGPVEDMHLIVVHTITATLRAMRGAISTTVESPNGAADTTLAELADVDEPEVDEPRVPAPLAAQAIAAPTIFVDRDGVINRNRDDYVKGWDEFEFLPGACDAIARLSQAGYRIFVVTNQACIGKGLTSLAAVEDLHRRMLDDIACAGGQVEAVLFCPHRADEGCACRKPSPGLLLRARDEYGVDLADAVFIGDSAGDMRAAAAADVPALLVLSGLGWRAARAGAAKQPHVWLVARDLQHAANLILGGSPLERAQAPVLRALVGVARRWAQARRIAGHILAPRVAGSPVVDVAAGSPPA
jgi:D-sedoheptulose 7-phosphate isomerase